MAVRAESITQLVLGSVKLIGLLGAAFWLGVVWRRATAAAVWISFLGSLVVWALMSAELPATTSPAVGQAARAFVSAADALSLRGLSEPKQIVVILAAEFGLMIFASLFTRPHDTSLLEPFYARLHTPVGREDAVRWDEPPPDLPESATLGIEGTALDYRKSSRFAYARLQKLGVEIPRMTWFDWGWLPGGLGARRSF